MSLAEPTPQFPRADTADEPDAGMAVIRTDIPYPVWSPWDAFEAAAVLLAFLVTARPLSTPDGRAGAVHPS
jgi:hypothetical protein